MRWFLSLFGQTLEKGSTAIDVFLWIVLAALIIGVLYVWLKNGSRLLGTKNLSVRGFADEIEDITSDDMERLIGQEVAAQRWRSAARYLYLRSLQDLQNAGSIVWKKDKTNRDYLREVAAPNTHAAFARAVAVFESAWYGDEPVNEAEFHNAQAVHDAVRQTLRGTS